MCAYSTQLKLQDDNCWLLWNAMRSEVAILLFQFFAERVAGDTKQPGALHLVAGGHLHGLSDHFPFEQSDGFLKMTLAAVGEDESHQLLHRLFNRRTLAVSNCSRIFAAFGCEIFAAAEDHRLLDGIGKFPDIAGPGVMP